MGEPAVYIVGNGKMAAVLKNGDYVQVFGPPYSSPALFASELKLPPDVTRDAPKHLEKAGIWQTVLRYGQDTVGTITDFALADEPCIVRRFETEIPVRMQLFPMAEDGSCFHSLVRSPNAFQYEVMESTDKAAQILLKTQNANAFYVDYPLPFPQYFRIIVRGDATVESADPFAYEICVNGTAELLIIGGPDYPACDLATRRIEGCGYDTMLQRTISWWQNMFAEISALSEIPANMPYRENVVKAIEDTVICMITQQAEEGGVMAGYAYHMGYVRDQFGVCMAMLHLGMYSHAKRMLQFYINTFRQSGKICDAQALGIPDRFHHAENEKTEITGYLLLQFFRYAEKTGDMQLLKDNVDFLMWLYEQQVSQIHNDTLPFNGDETYIAGGLLPRDAINDGSAEATMLFILSADRLMSFLLRENLAGEDTLAQMQNALEAVRDAYEEHFFVDGQYTLNAPSRLEGLELPQYRYGVCMNFGAPECDYFGWTKREEDGVYLCPKCQQLASKPTRKTGRYSLPSALLMPAYLGSDLLENDSTRQYLLTLVEKLRRDGHFYSNETMEMNVGYDYGLLLYNLVAYDLPGKETVCKKLLELRDEAGVWSEYYDKNAPAGSRYRAWESGINIDALMQYAKWIK